MLISCLNAHFCQHGLIFRVKTMQSNKQALILRAYLKK
jgi:hypothetical protein